MKYFRTISLSGKEGIFPQEGIFWFAGDTFISVSYEVSPDRSRHIIKMHETEWERSASVGLFRDNGRAVPYDHFPRGRVVCAYDKAEEKYTASICVDDCLRPVIDDIKFLFKLDDCCINYIGPVDTVTSEHYTCTCCR